MSGRLVLAGVLAAVSTPLAAADWGFDPYVAVSGVYNDNLRLTEVRGEEIEVAGATLDARLTVRAATPRSSFALTPRLRSSFYPGDEDQEADDQFIRMLAQHEAERATALLDLSYSRVVTLGDYFPTAAVGGDDELGNPVQGEGVGRTTQRNREERLWLAPTVSFELSPRYSLDFTAEYLDVSYDTQVSGDRTDYVDVRGTIGLSMGLSETSKLTFRGGYGWFDPSDEDRTDAFGLDAEWSNDFSETAQAYVRAGATRVEARPTAAGGGSSWEQGFTGGAGVRWTYEVVDLWLDATRSLDPNSDGYLVTRDQFRVEVGRRLGPMTRVYLAGRVIMDDQTTGDSGFVARDYATGILGFSWRFARSWTLTGSYDYRWREYEGDATDATSNAGNLAIVYEPNRR